MKGLDIMYFQNFLLDLLSNFFDFFTMELFTLTFFRYTHVHQKTYYRYLFLGINLIISAIPYIPYMLLISIILSFIYFFLVSSFRFKDSILFCIKYQLITNILYFVTGFFVHLQILMHMAYTKTLMISFLIIKHLLV